MGVLGVLLSLIVLLLCGLAALLVWGWNKLDDEGKKACREAWQNTALFYKCVWFFVRGGNYSKCPYFTTEEELPIRVRIFGMCLVFRLWGKDHYRNGSFQDDMKKNLRNVAIPGTGIPLSIFAYHKILSYFFLFVLYPIIALGAALNAGNRQVQETMKEYNLQLLQPTDWFGYWRLNCALASYHSLVTKEKGYALEDKLTFLQVAKEKDIAVSPWLDLPAIICKHRNEEGGLGYKMYSNAVSGGDWIIQEVLSNEGTIADLLPERAPLSTFRVITSSTSSEKKITALSCVWRAGRKGAETDHSAVLFDVDQKSKTFRAGITNTHWYRLGLDKIFSTPWTAQRNIVNHPDNDKKVQGKKISEVDSIMEFATKAHKTMLPGVPIVGWDVAMTNKGMLMLECNLSCNFFLGSFDEKAYFNFVDEYFVDLEHKQES